MRAKTNTKAGTAGTNLGNVIDIPGYVPPRDLRG